MTTRTCDADGGTGIGAGHRCHCVGSAGHEPFYGFAHGCSCGALWREQEESREVREARRSVAEADPAILAAAVAYAGGGYEEWADLNVMRQFQLLVIGRDMVSAAYNVTFSPENLARVVAETGLSLQSVTEVARCLKKA